MKRIQSANVLLITVTALKFQKFILGNVTIDAHDLNADDMFVVPDKFKTSFALIFKLVHPVK